MNREDCLTGLTLYKGNTSEAIVLTAYIQAGFLASLPFGGGAAYDLIVDTGARLIKAQVKTGKLETGCVIYNARRHRGSECDTFRSYKRESLIYLPSGIPVMKSFMPFLLATLLPSRVDCE